MNKHDIQVGDYILKEDLVRDFDTFQAVVKAFEEADYPLDPELYEGDDRENYEDIKSPRNGANKTYGVDYVDFVLLGGDLNSFNRRRDVNEFLPKTYKPEQNTVCEFSLNEQDWFSCRVKMYARDTKDNSHGVLLRTFLGEKREQDLYFNIDEVSFRESQDPHLKLADLGYKFSERCAIIKALGVGVND